MQQIAYAGTVCGLQAESKKIALDRASFFRTLDLSSRQLLLH
jgi:hypothetical protein